MKGLLDNKKIDIPCEKCGRKSPKTIGWLKTHKQFTCACGTTIQVDSRDFVREIGKVDKALADLQKSFKGLGKLK